MRLTLGILCIAGALVACPVASSKDVGAGGDDDGGGSGSGAPFSACNQDTDCAPAAATCCDCPTFAVNIADPSHRACAGVTCPVMDSCPDNVSAVCSDQGKCELACTQLVCVGACAAGYAIDDATGCLSCACATPLVSGCAQDTDCVETRDDCCGCHFGGNDTAVLASDRSAYDSMLMCAPSPQCPVVNVCESGAAPHCVAGACKLAATAGIQGQICGRGDLPACPGGYACTVNKDLKASLLGVGVCVPQI